MLLGVKLEVDSESEIKKKVVSRIFFKITNIYADE